MEKRYPEVVDFEVSTHIIVAATRNHSRDNALALALSDALGTRYAVSGIQRGGKLVASPEDDKDPSMAAGEDAPHYLIDPPANNFLIAFDSGSHKIVDFHDTWFTARLWKR